MRMTAQTYRVGGHDHHYVHSDKCDTCNSDFLIEIENGMLLGRSHERILDSLRPMLEPGDAPLPSPQSLRRHRANHMSAGHAVMLEIADERARQIGISISSAAQSIVDSTTLARSVLQKTWEGVVSGDLAVSVKDGMDAARFLETFGSSASIDLEAFVSAFVAMHAEIEAEVGSGVYEQIAARFNTNPVLQGLARRWAEQHDQAYQQPEVPEDLLPVRGPVKAAPSKKAVAKRPSRAKKKSTS